MSADEKQAAPQPEPWLRGSHGDLKPIQRAVVHALELVREDAEKWGAKLTDQEFATTPYGLPSPGVQLRHIVGTLDRFLAYAEGRPLSKEQFAYLATERDPTSRATAVRDFSEGLDTTIAWLRAHQDMPLDAPIKIGRKGLPASVGGILVHMAEHSERHIGQFVTTTLVILAMRTTAA